MALSILTNVYKQKRNRSEYFQLALLNSMFICIVENITLFDLAY